MLTALLLEAQSNRAPLVSVPNAGAPWGRLSHIGHRLTLHGEGRKNQRPEGQGEHPRQDIRNRPEVCHGVQEGYEVRSFKMTECLFAGVFDQALQRSRRAPSARSRSARDVESLRNELEITSQVNHRAGIGLAPAGSTVRTRSESSVLTTLARHSMALFWHFVGGPPDCHYLHFSVPGLGLAEALWRL